MATNNRQNLNEAIHNQGLLLEGEIKDSFAGHRAEPRSVDTGNAMGKVTTDNSKELISIVHDGGVPYTIYLEKGTTKMAPRRHFSNSLARRRSAIIVAIAGAVKGKVL